MKIEQIALQTYTIRNALKTPADIAASLKKVAAIGYRAIQVSGMGPIDEKELVSITDGEGLRICATHEPSGTILDEPEKVVDRLRALGCEITAYPAPKGIDFGSADAVHALIEKLNRSGRGPARSRTDTRLPQPQSRVSTHRRPHRIRSDIRKNRFPLPSRRNRHVLGSVRRSQSARLVPQTSGAASHHSPQGLPRHRRAETRLRRNRQRQHQFPAHHRRRRGKRLPMVRGRTGHLPRRSLRLRTTEF